MANVCCVVGCNVLPSKEVILFKVPTSRTLRQKWTVAIKAPQKLSINDSVCSEHFLKTDYEKIRGKVRLKAAVVPSIFNLKQKSVTTENTSSDIDKENLENQPKDIKEIEGKSECKLLKDNVKKENENKDFIEECFKCDVDNGFDNKPSEAKELCSTTSLVLSSNAVQNSESNKINNTVNNSKVIHEKDSMADGNSVKTTEHDSTVPSAPELSNQRRGNDKHQDIEDLLTNYTIKQNNIHSITEPVKDERKDDDVVMVADDSDLATASNADRNFIEVPADKDGEGRGDCVMLLENVQVDVDPNSLLMVDERYQGDITELSDDSSTVQSVRQDDKPADPISLLTSSDEDDVILQEPHIDTVEVSDETDEDDVPLVRLVNPSSKTGSLTNGISPMDLFLYICLECPFKTKDKPSMLKHREDHTKVLLMCPLCGYMTASESQLSKHKRQHKGKKFACKHCNYRAKYKMSLKYHMKSHNVKRLKCNNCDFQSEFESEVLSHSALCTRFSDSEDNSINRTNERKTFVCPLCFYSSDKALNLRRHHKRMHKTNAEDSDYEPCEPELENHSMLSQKSGKRKSVNNSKCSGKKKKHLCTICEYSTNKPSDLRRHSRTHRNHNNA
ncbi:hypothetical protein ACJJTC_019173 [Scirpophaga incertulas]